VSRASHWQNSGRTQAELKSELTLAEKKRTHRTHLDVGAIESLIDDIEGGQDPSEYRAPHVYRSSMFTLSQSSLVPSQVSPRRRLASQDSNMGDHQSGDDTPNPSISKAPYTRAESATEVAAPHGRNKSQVSAYSSSVYSDHSSATSEDQKTFSHAKVRIKRGREPGFLLQNELVSVSSAVVTSQKEHTTDLLTSRPSKLFQDRNDPLNRTSLAPYQDVALSPNLDCSETELATSPPEQIGAASKEDIPEREAEPGSNLVVSGSSDASESDHAEDKVRAPHMSGQVPLLTLQTAVCDAHCERQGSKAPWLRRRDKVGMSLS
jgi:hypothetical protein